MKKILILSIAFGVVSLCAKPAFMGGLTYKFGADNSLENLGTTVKVLSSDEDKKAVVSAGASYYPWAKKKQFGIDVGVGYSIKNVNVQAGWDFIANQPAVSLGYAGSINIDETSTNKKVIDEETIKNCKNKEEN